jgi:hypothetical protein
MQGSGSLVMSLPAAWVHSNAVKPGDLLDIEANGRTLKIKIGAPTRKAEAPTATPQRSHHGEVSPAG